MKVIFTVLITAFFWAASTSPSFAAVTWYIDKAAWQADAGPYTTITFAELPANTFIFEQYADLGVHFTDGSDQVFFNPNYFVEDGFGLNGAFDETTLEFDEPMTTIAVDYPGSIVFKLFSDGELIYSSPLFGSIGPGQFVGLISTQPFDEVLLHDGGLFVDDLHFGPPIPAPGALVLLGIIGLFSRSPRQRS